MTARVPGYEQSLYVLLAGRHLRYGTPKPGVDAPLEELARLEEETRAMLPGLQPVALPTEPLEEPAAAPPAPVAPPAEPPTVILEAPAEPAPLEVWCDGSGTTGEKPCASAALAARGDLVLAEVREARDRGTNNVAEVLALVLALRLAVAVLRSELPEALHADGDPRTTPLPIPSGRIVLHSDSEFALGACAPASTWKVKPHLEPLVREGRALARRLPGLVLRHVPGHSGLPHNERCDVLAGAARKARVAALNAANDNASLLKGVA